MLTKEHFGILQKRANYLFIVNFGITIQIFYPALTLTCQISLQWRFDFTKRT